MPHFKLTLSYDGTAFVGWQRQATGPSIQGLLEGALAALDGQSVVVAGAGRTDAGVHALGQVATCSLTRDTDAGTVLRAVNARLPPTIRILDVAEVSAAFHARFSSTSKIYRYRIWSGDVVSPFEFPYVWHLPSPLLDVNAMDVAARALEGTHDFSCFQSAGSETHTTERTVYSSRVRRGAGRSPDIGHGGSLITYEVSGDGFLKHSVRAIVGTLVEVGRGRRTSSWLQEVMASRSRSCAGPTAPAAGLVLVSVSYA